MSFALDLQKFAEQAGAAADDAVGRIVGHVAAEIDKRSPVGDAKYWKNPPPKGYIGGHFRGNWQLGIGSIPAGEIPAIVPGPRAIRADAGGEAYNRITMQIPEEAAGKVYYLANNAPYAMRLEDGWSRQAPSGVVGLTVTMFQQIVNDAVTEVRK